MTRPATPNERALGYALLIYWPFVVAVAYPIWIGPNPVFRWPGVRVWIVGLPTTFVLGLALLGYLAPWPRVIGWGVAVGLLMGGFGFLLDRAVPPSGPPALAAALPFLLRVGATVALCVAVEGLGFLARLASVRWKRAQSRS